MRERLLMVLLEWVAIGNLGVCMAARQDCWIALVVLWATMAVLQGKRSWVIRVCS